jgi:hypothetical protein
MEVDIHYGGGALIQDDDSDDAEFERGPTPPGKCDVCWVNDNGEKEADYIILGMHDDIGGFDDPLLIPSPDVLICGDCSDGWSWDDYAFITRWPMEADQHVQVTLNDGRVYALDVRRMPE